MIVLVIGLGSIARKHISAIRIEYPSAKIFALRSGKNYDSIDNVVNIFSFDELIVKPDFAIISTPTYLHSKYIIELSVRGIPMMIEKPALHNLHNSEQILSLTQKHNAFTYVAFNLRFHPCILFIKNYISQRISSINEINVYCGSYLPDWRPMKSYKDIYSSHLQMGGGVHLDLIHELDYITWIFGAPLKYTSFTSSNSSLKIKAPDCAYYFLNYLNFNAVISLNYFRKDSKRIIELVLENDTISVDLISNKITNINKEILFCDNQYCLLNTYISQIRYFVNKVTKNEQPMNNFKESLDVLKIALNHETITK
jgi:predicted dehydrogenase